MKLSRRDVARAGVILGAFAVTSAPSLLSAQASGLVERKIPSSGESIPGIGIGTARRYDVAEDSPERAEIKEVIRQFAKAGGRVIDTAPSYGAAEVTIGGVIAELGNRDALVLATKLGARGRDAGIAQLEQSLRRLRTMRLDVVAVHNLQDTVTQLATLREWKRAGRIRYLGLSTSSERQYADFERVMRTETLDVIQVDYALDNRKSGERLIPLAADRGVAVMINLPFGRGRLFRAVQGQTLPDWAGEFDCRSWAQFFLKYIVSNPAVTCVIPGTAQVKYLADNLGGGRGRLPDAAMRTRMEKFIDAI